MSAGEDCLKTNEFKLTPKHWPQIDQIISGTLWPKEFQKCSKTCGDIGRLKQWKAVEYKNFMLYIAPVIFKMFYNTPVSVNFLHWLLMLSSICYESSCTDMNEDSINNIMKLIQDWQLVAKNFLLERKQLIVFHAIIHIPKYLKMYGPAQNYSAFVFEGLLAIIRRLVTSPNGTVAQIVRRFMDGRVIRMWANEKLQNLDQLGIFVQECLAQKGKTAKKIIYKRNLATSFEPNEAKLLQEIFGGVPHCTFQNIFVKEGITYMPETRAKLFKYSNNIAVCRRERSEDIFFINIQKFFTVGIVGYVLYKHVLHLGKINDHLMPPSNGVSLVSFNMERYGNHIFLLQFCDTLGIIETDFICNTGVLVKCKDQLFFTPLCNKFEHN